MKDLSYAKKTLAYYMRMAVTASGRKWDADNEAEVHFIIDEIEEHIKQAIHQTAMELERREMWK